ncbi:MAG TPA: Rieske 2Fe-2S domain-containing protein [Candidatus Binataceae bacterium]|nr:Rieske 2Fe-2S domain-containing protein [Candidatus Binataceae bacterium]
MIPNSWYPIFESSQLKTDRPVGVKRLGSNIVLWRARDGRVVATPDRCPHRSAQLSRGRIHDGCLECPYHGLLFDSAGKCVRIPANGENAPVPGGFDLPLATVRERHDLVWQWNGAGTPSSEVPWLSEMPEETGAVRSYSYEVAVPYLRVMENLLDFHHFYFVHRRALIGAGPRLENYDAHIEGDTVVMSGQLAHERKGWMRPTLPFRAVCKLPALAHIEIFGASINYLLTPIDDTHTWIWGRYQGKSSGFLGGLVTSLSARFDRALFEFQDKAVLKSQVDPAGDFSSFRLYEADRAIALFFGMRKRALLDASNEHPVSAAAGR